MICVLLPFPSDGPLSEHIVSSIEATRTRPSYELSKFLPEFKNGSRPGAINQAIWGSRSERRKMYGKDFSSQAVTV